jgi:hypothetical protein
MPCIRHQEAWGISQVLLLVHDHSPLAPISRQPYRLGEGPKLFYLFMTASNRDRTKALWMISLQLCRDEIYSSPLTRPLDVA